MKKKHKKPAPAPVCTGHDRRAEERENESGCRDREPSAPDGISGSWK